MAQKTFSCNNIRKRTKNRTKLNLSSISHFRDLGSSKVIDEINEHWTDKRIQYRYNYQDEVTTILYDTGRFYILALEKNKLLTYKKKIKDFYNRDVK